MQIILKTLSWTFLHSLWQGLIAALLAAIIISATKKASSKLRYNMLGVLLVLFLATTIITFRVVLKEQQNLLLATSTVNPVAVENTEAYSADFSTHIAESSGLTTQLTTWFNNNAGILMMGWCIFFLLNCLKLTTGLASINRLRHYKTIPITEDWRTTLTMLQAKLGITQPVQLLQSALVKVPVVIGVLKPVILVPAGLLANIPPDQAEAILLHELAHVKRKDYLVNLLQRFADAVFFFNPAFNWISSLLRQEREACCDDIAVANTCEKRNYIEALVSFQEYSLNNTSPAMAFRTKREYLLNRVKRIITNENKRLNLVEKTALVAGVLIFSAFTMVTGEKSSAKKITPGEVVAPATTTDHLLSQPVSGMMVDDIPQTEIKKNQAKVATLPDTIPIKKEPAPTVIVKDEKLLTHFSTETVEDNGVKRQTVKALDQSGSTYLLVRHSGQPIVLTVNGKQVPENELNNWTAVLDQLYNAADKKGELNNNKFLVEKKGKATNGKHDWKPTKDKKWENDKKEWESKMNEWEAADKKAKNELKEIENIKQKMQQKKNAIGIDKEKLKAIEDRKENEKENNREHAKEIEKERQQLSSKLEEKRTALEADRTELNKKRVDWERARREAEELKRHHQGDKPVKKTNNDDKGDGNESGIGTGSNTKKLFTSKKTNLFRKETKQQVQLKTDLHTRQVHPLKPETNATLSSDLIASKPAFKDYRIGLKAPIQYTPSKPLKKPEQQPTIKLVPVKTQ